MKKTDAKYMEIYTNIRERIKKGEYKIGAILPSGDELAITYHCSKLTIKKGLDLLVQEGILIRRRGSGTFVLRIPNDSAFILGPNASLLNTIGEERIHSSIHNFTIELPTPLIAEKLKIEENQYIYNIIRERFIDTVPYSIEQTFMPLSVIPGLEEKHLEKSIYNYITKELNLKPQLVHVNIKGEKPTQQDIDFLAINSTDFVIILEKVASLQDGTVFEYSITRHRYENFNFEAVFVQNT